MKIRVIRGELLRDLLDHRVMPALLRTAMIDASRGRCVLPLRWALPLPGGRGALGMMPGYLATGDVAGIKLISLVPPEHRGERSSHLGLMLLYDAAGLQPTALLCGATLTELRTAAVTALATDTLARPDAKVLAVLGTGEQAKAHVQALQHVREFREVRIWGRSRARADELAASLESRVPVRFTVHDEVADAVGDADVICTVTSSKEPVLAGNLVPPGAHVNLIGSSVRDSAETDAALVIRSTFIVDLRASAMAQAGELLRAIEAGLASEGTIVAELGEVLAGDHVGRATAQEITVYKSLGIAAQDLALSGYALSVAEAQGRGDLIEL
jgi:ornithine cyclodeaminase